MLYKASKAKKLILHADDMGLAHSVNLATFSAFQNGHISSGSVMVPCSGFIEVAEFARAHREADIGIHLTLTSEWSFYRWGSIAPAQSVPTLLDEQGYFWNSPRLLARHADPGEVYIELCAQIDGALRAGILPTHLDSHMFALFEIPDMSSVIVRVAREYRLPFLLSRNMPLRLSTIRELNRHNPLLDALIFLRTSIRSEEVKGWYVNAVSQLQPGVTQLIVHLGYNDSELQATIGENVGFGAAWRQNDLDAIMSVEFKEALRQSEISLVSWRQVAQTYAL